MWDLNGLGLLNVIRGNGFPQHTHTHFKSVSGGSLLSFFGRLLPQIKTRPFHYQRCSAAAVWIERAGLPPSLHEKGRLLPFGVRSGGYPRSGATRNATQRNGRAHPCTLPGWRAAEPACGGHPRGVLGGALWAKQINQGGLRSSPGRDPRWLEFFWHHIMFCSALSKVRCKTLFKIKILLYDAKSRDIRIIDFR